MEHAIRAESLEKSYGQKRAVKGISFTIPRGCVYGFLGPNGAGKTTTLRMLLDIIRPDSGQIDILGQNNVSHVRSQIGYLPEEKGLYKAMTAESFMAFLGSIKGMNKSIAKLKAKESLEKFGMGEYLKTKLGALSKGQGQKIQFLSSIIHDPEIIIFDEPFSGLDPVNQQSLEEMIMELASRGKTVIFSTHVMQHAERLCDKFLLISAGKKVFDGDLEAARSILKKRAFLVTPNNPELLKSLDGVESVMPEMGKSKARHHSPNAKRWEITMNRDLTPHSILEMCYSEGVEVVEFEFSEPSLHDIFVHLVEANESKA